MSAVNDPHNLNAVNEILDLVGRIPNGGPLIRMLRRLGFWVGSGDTPTDPPRFDRNLASMADVELGDAAGFWQSELSRATEIAGVLDATKVQAKLAVTRARAQATTAVLETVPTGERKPTKAEIDAKVASDPAVITAEDSLALLDMTIAAFGGIREGLEGRCKVLSREITRRGDLARVGVRT